MKTSATAFDCILGNTVLDFEVQSGIIKNGISDHFDIFWVLRTISENKNFHKYIILRANTDGSVEKFKELMSTADWNLITQTLYPIDSYNILLITF